MRRKVKNEDSRPLNQTQPTSVNSSCHNSAKCVLTSKNGGRVSPWDSVPAC